MYKNGSERPVYKSTMRVLGLVLIVVAIIQVGS
jgi:hypothetical protein